MLHQPGTKKLLDSVSENIFIADLDYTLIWMNHYAEELMDTLAGEFGYTDHRDLVGKSIHEFHANPERQRKILEEGPFPYRARIALKNYRADITVTQIYDESNEKIGYMLIWKDVTKRVQEEKENKRLLEELSASVLPTILENTLLVPLVGRFTKERSEFLHARVLNECVQKEADFVVFDFSGLADIDELIASEMEKMASAIALLGGEAVFVGFSPKVASQFQLLHNMKSIHTFHTFRQGIQYIMKQQGFKLVKI